eukprot:g1552.t1
MQRLGDSGLVQNPSGAPIVESWAWVFDSLWISSEIGLIRGKSCLLNVPLTIMFENGEPVRMLTTASSGFVVRKLFPSHSNESKARGKAYMRKEKIRYVLDELLRFSSEQKAGVDEIRSSTAKYQSELRSTAPDGKDNNNSEPDIVATAWYKDGATEGLNLETIAMLLGHRAWLQQLIALQAYVKPKYIKRGQFIATVNLSLVDGQLLAEKEHTEVAFHKKDIAMDALTKQLSHHIEQAYERLTAKPDRTGTIVSLRHSRVRILRLTAEFVIDNRDRLWFSHAVQVIVQKLSPPIRDVGRDASLAAEHAAAAEKELRSLVRAATFRGVDIAVSFAHFDAAGRGSVTERGFLNGLSLLGIQLTPMAAELFLARFGRNDNDEIGLKEFSDFMLEAFVHKYASDEDDIRTNPLQEKPKTSSKPKSRKRSSGKSRKRSRKSRSRAKKKEGAQQNKGTLSFPSPLPPADIEAMDSIQAARDISELIMDQSKVPVTLPPGARKSTVDALEELKVLEEKTTALKRKEEREKARNKQTKVLEEKKVVTIPTNETEAERKLRDALYFISDINRDYMLNVYSEHHEYRPLIQKYFQSSMEDGGRNEDQNEDINYSQLLLILCGVLNGWICGEIEASIVERESRCIDILEFNDLRLDEKVQIQMAIKSFSSSPRSGAYDPDVLHFAVKTMENAESKMEAVNIMIAMLEHNSVNHVQQAASDSKEEVAEAKEGFNAFKKAIPSLDVQSLAYSKNEINDELEQLFMESGISIGFRILDVPVDSDETKNRQEPNESSAESKALAAIKAIRGLSQQDGFDEFSIVVLPDMFDTIQSLDEYFSYLRNLYPKARILYISFPSQRGTHFHENSNVNLNNAYLSECFEKLLHHLKRERRWHWKPRPGVGDLEVDIDIDASRRASYIIGLGNGANVALYFAIFSARKNSRAPLQNSLRALMLINSFLYIDKGLFRTLHQIIRFNSKASPIEQMENIFSLLFSKRYIKMTERSTVLQKFFHTRHTLTKEFSEKMKPLTGVHSGVASLAAGALSHVDLRPYLDRLSLPVCAIQSSENSFVMPMQIDPLVQCFSGEAVFDSIDMCLKVPRGTPAIHVTWLKGGHQIVTERRSFLSKCIEKFVTSSGPALSPSAAVDLLDDKQEKGLVRLTRRGAARGLTTRHDASRIITGEKMKQNAYNTKLIQSGTNLQDDEDKTSDFDEKMKDRVAFEEEELDGEDDGTIQEGVFEAKNGENKDTDVQDSEMQLEEKKAPEKNDEEEQEKEGDQKEQPAISDKDVIARNVSDVIQKSIAERGMNWLRGQLEKRGLPDDISKNVMIERLHKALVEETIATEEYIENLRKTERQKIEEQRLAEIEETKERELQERQALVDRKLLTIKRRKEAQEKEEKEREIEENRLMAAEDKLARAIHQDLQKLEQTKKTNEDAREMIKELQEGREYEQKMEGKRNEDKARAQRRENRRRRLYKLQEKYKDDVVALEGNVVGYGLEIDGKSFTSADIDRLVEGGGRMRSDVMELRKRKDTIIVKHEHSVDKRTRLEKQVEKWDVELRDLRRTIRENTGKIQALGNKKKTRRNLMKLSKLEEEQKDLNSLREVKEEEFVDLHGQLKIAREEMHTIAVAVQRIARLERKQVNEIAELIEKMGVIERTGKERTSQYKRTMRTTQDEKEQFVQLLKKSKLRKRDLESEVRRVADIHASYVDSKIWHNGLTQRVKREELLEFLNEKIDEMTGTIDIASEQISKRDSSLETMHQEKDVLISDMEEVKLEHGNLQKVYNYLMEGHKNDDGGKKETEMKNAMADIAKSSAQQLSTLAKKVRGTPADERTLEEKRWVSYDMMMNPGAYPVLMDPSINEHDADVYKFDENYRSNLDESVVRRIAVLPEQLNLALPFLYSDLEIECHALLQKYTFARGEDRLRERDLSMFEAEAEQRKIREVNAKIEKIRLRGRRQKIREQSEDELTPEQSKWRRLDRILCPDKYPTWDPMEEEIAKEKKEEEEWNEKIERANNERTRFMDSLEVMPLKKLKEAVLKRGGNGAGMRGVLIKRLREMVHREEKEQAKKCARREAAIEKDRKNKIRFGLSAEEIRFLCNKRRKARDLEKTRLEKIRDIIAVEQLENADEKYIHGLLHKFGWDNKFPTLAEEIAEEEARKVVEAEEITKFNEEREEEERQRREQMEQEEREKIKMEAQIQKVKNEEQKAASIQEKQYEQAQAEAMAKAMIKECSKYPKSVIKFDLLSFRNIKRVGKSKRDSHIHEASDVFAEFAWNKKKLGKSGSTSISRNSQWADETQAIEFPYNVDRKTLMHVDVYSTNPGGGSAFGGRLSLPGLYLWDKGLEAEMDLANALKSIEKHGPDKAKTLHIHVISASNLMKADEFGDSDPFVDIFFSKEADATSADDKIDESLKRLGTSPVVRNSLNPTWNDVQFGINIQTLKNTEKAWMPTKVYLRLKAVVQDFDKHERGKVLGEVHLDASLLEGVLAQCEENLHAASATRRRKVVRKRFNLTSKDGNQGSLELGFSLKVSPVELDRSQFGITTLRLSTKENSLATFAKQAPLYPFINQADLRDVDGNSIPPNLLESSITFRTTIETEGFMKQREQIKEKFLQMQKEKAEAAMKGDNNAYRVGGKLPKYMWVQIHSAENLQVADEIVGSSDPYANVYWRNKKIGMTKVEKRNLNPLWDSFFRLEIPDSLVGTELKVEVFDMDIGGAGDFLGQIILKGSEFFHPSKYAPDVFHTFDLDKRDGDSSDFVGGQILVAALPAKSNLMRAELEATRLRKEVDIARELERKKRGADGNFTEEELRKMQSMKPTTVVDNLKDVPRALRIGNVLVKKPEGKRVHQLLNVEERKIGKQTSAWHEFTLPKDLLALELRVTVIFQGTFEKRGYILGRVAGALYRIEDLNISDTDELPLESSPLNDSAISIGYSPKAQCTPNTADRLGKIVIVHRPNSISLPVTPGRFRVIIGAASDSKYSITASCVVADDVITSMLTQVEEAKKYLIRNPLCQEEIEDLHISIKLGERKYMLVENLIRDIELACANIEHEIQALNDRLDAEDEELRLTEEEEIEVDEKIGEKELEFSKSVKILMSRKQELLDIHEGLQKMTQYKRDREAELDNNKNFLARVKKELPHAAFAVLGSKNAIQMCKDIGLHIRNIQRFQNAQSAAENVDQSNTNRKAANDTSHVTTMLTAAQRLRKKAREIKRGIHAVNIFASKSRRSKKKAAANAKDSELSLREQEWLAHDKILHPDEYDSDELEDENPLFKIKYTKDDLERILLAKPQQLTQKEKKIKTIMKRYEDRRFEDRPVDSSNVARKKKPEDRTDEEADFVFFDRLLHPEWYRNAKKIKQLLKSQRWSAVDTKGVNEVNEAEIMHPEFQKYVVGDEDSIAADDGKEVEETKVEKKTSTENKNSGDGSEENPENTLHLRKKLKKAMTKERLERLIKARPKEIAKFSEAEAYVHNLMTDKFAALPLFIAGQSMKDFKFKKRLAKLGVIDHEASPEFFDIDIDSRCRIVFMELELSLRCTAKKMSTNVLHGVQQRFDVPILQERLSAELDRLLILQVTEREKNLYKYSKIDEQIALASNTKVKVDSDSDSSDEDESKKPRRMRKKKFKKGNVKGTGYNIGRSKKEKGSRRRVELLEEYRSHGPGYCLACKTKPCQYEYKVDIERLKKRVNEVEKELLLVRKIPTDQRMIESTVALSATRGGVISFAREDLILELQTEIQQKSLSIRMAAVDKELHDAYNTYEDHFETQALHGYKQMQNTMNVIKALERERNYIISHEISVEIVDNILDYMLEGWMFGEKKSNLKVMGYVPSIKKEGPLSIRDSLHFNEHGTLKDRDEDELERGDPAEKWKLVAKKAAKDEERVKAIKLGSEQDLLLKRTENTLKFGLFSLAMMYFSDKSLRGENGPEGITKERRKMQEEELKRQLRQKRADYVESRATAGMERRRLREEAERQKMRDKLMQVMSKRARERKAALKIQSAYRGRLGRLAAAKWAIRKTEIQAIKALRYAAATAIQSLYRGVLGRREAEIQAAELADYIAEMRRREAAEAEEEYWRTHTFARIKRNILARFNKKTKKEKEKEDEETKKAEEERLALEEQEDKKWVLDYDDDDEKFAQEMDELIK